MTDTIPPSGEAPVLPEATAPAVSGSADSSTDSIDWLDPKNQPASGDDLLEWASAHVPLWTRLATELNIDAFGVWELEQVVHDAEAVMKDIESGFATMYSPSCKAAEEKYENADIATLYLDARAAIEQLNAALHGVLREKVRSFADMACEDGEREEILGILDVPVPAAPWPSPARPHGFAIELMQPGVLGIGFQTMDDDVLDGSDDEPIRYEVQRRIADGAFEHLLSCDSTGFRDTALPVGTRRVVYRVTAHRGRRIGTPGYARVDFFPEANGASLVENPSLSA
ncbi:MAG: hypothetical protein NCW75_01825 [Phycisphaera sp.]|nr:MAG: hypothetical protein NCW75_01825 [Phycisphaera sp.]